MLSKNQRGFTLIELMIVVTILGIIIAVAIPSYFDYATRAKAGEGVSMFVPAKAAIGEFTLSQGRFPDNNAEAGLEVPTAYVGNYVESMTVTPGGVVRVKFDDPALLNGELVFTPTMIADGSIRWICSTAIPNNLVGRPRTGVDT